MTINELRKQFPDEAACRLFFESMIWPSGRVCPHCGSLKSWAIKSKYARKGLYECGGCRLQFTVTTKTPLHSTKLPLWTWLLTMYLMSNSSKGISSVILGKLIGTTQKTAWKLGHAIRAMMALVPTETPLLMGIVELDEKYLGGRPRFQEGVKHKRRAVQVHLSSVLPLQLHGKDQLKPPLLLMLGRVRFALLLRRPLIRPRT